MIRLLNAGIALCLMVTVISAEAVPITLSNGYLFRETRSLQDGTVPGGFLNATDIIQYGIDPVPLAGSTGVATTSITGENFALLGPPFCGGLASAPSQALCGETEYTSDRGNGLWEITATNGSDTATISLGTLGDPIVPPFATDILIDVLGDGGLDVSWMLPSDTGAANQIRLRIHDAAGARLFQDTLAVGATSAMVPAGLLTDSGTYWARVMIEETQPPIEFVRRASTFAEFQFSVPEPTTVMLMGLGLAGLGFARRRSLSASRAP